MHLSNTNMFYPDANCNHYSCYLHVKISFDWITQSAGYLRQQTSQSQLCKGSLQRVKCSRRQRGKSGSVLWSAKRSEVSPLTPQSVEWVGWVNLFYQTDNFLTATRRLKVLESISSKCKDFQRLWNTSTDPGKRDTQTIHPHRHVHTPSHKHQQAGMHESTCTHAHTHTPKGKCRYTNISILQPKTVSLCWFFWAPKSGLGAETVPTRFFYAMQQVFWGKERCTHLMGMVQSGKWEIKMKIKNRDKCGYKTGRWHKIS